MPTFRIGLTQIVAEGADIDIEAPDLETAERLALEKANKGEVTTWQFLECIETPEIVESTPHAAT